MGYQFSPSGNFFTNTDLKENYAEGEYPADALDVDDEIFWKFASIPPEGKVRTAGKGGFPVWSDVPELSHDELVTQATMEKALKIAEANTFMNDKQWPGKAALGRLKGDEMKQYNLWLDYLDGLEATDTLSYPDFTFPEKPDGS